MDQIIGSAISTLACQAETSTIGARRFCCSGTLGALLTDGTNQYILSNNHVLGRSDQAVAGEDVSQPGMIDSNCNVATIVGDFTAFSPFGATATNVDAAIAQLRPGTMDSTGFIEDIGVPSLQW